MTSVSKLKMDADNAQFVTMNSKISLTKRNNTMFKLRTHNNSSEISVATQRNSMWWLNISAEACSLILISQIKWIDELMKLNFDFKNIIISNNSY